jgi:hypothetical protein
MKVRPDSVSISSALLTVALLSLIPTSLANALAGHDKVALARLDTGFREIAEMMSYLGLASLTVIFIALIVVWTGYIKRARSAWFVLFVVVWLWAFPLFVLPFVSGFVQGIVVRRFSELMYDAISAPGLARIAVESILIFCLMLVGLLLPIKRFLVAREAEEPIYRPSARLIKLSVGGVLAIIITLFAWVRVGALYEIPFSELNSTQRLPSPPPPPPGS